MWQSRSQGKTETRDFGDDDNDDDDDNDNVNDNDDRNYKIMWTADHTLPYIF